MTLWANFLDHRGRRIDKWHHYFPIYERHFLPYTGKPLTFIEIGCGDGGSLQMWKRFFGPHAQIIGLDIRPECGTFAEDQIAVRIGNQSDPVFLESVLTEFGVPDIVLDDGSHVMSDVRASFRTLYPRLDKNGVYMVEDLHTAYWPDFGGGVRAPGSFIEYCKDMIDELNADWSHGALAATEFTRTTQSLHFYDSVAIFERGRNVPKVAVPVG